MRRPSRLSIPLLLAALAAPVLGAEPPATPVQASLLEATPFTLGEAVALPSGETATTGVVLVIGADPELTRPRQDAMPVPQLGAVLAHAASRGLDGTLVVIAFGDADLGSSVLFFGPPELPSRLGPSDLARRLADAVQAGVRPVGAETAARALARGAAPLHVARFDDLAPFLVSLRCRIEPEALAAAGTPCPEAP